MSRKIRISQAMIVKNEEKNIEKALTWGKQYMYEQVVVDTGSTDRTVEIARSLGARIYHFDWIDDFAAAKNYAISKCRGDWIVFLDADEYFEPECAAKLPQLIDSSEEQGFNCILTAWVNLKDDGTPGTVNSQMRIFRHLPGMRYRRRIHEQVEYSGGTMHVGDATDLMEIMHTGYMTVNNEGKKKSSRNRRLIEMEVNEHPDDGDILSYLGDEQMFAGEYDDAIATFRKAIDLLKDGNRTMNGRYAYDYIYLIQILLNEKKDMDEAVRTYREAVQVFPEESDFACLIGDALFGQHRYREAAPYLKEAIDKVERYGITNRGAYTSSNLQNIYQKYAFCLYMTGDLDGAVRVSTIVMKADKKSVLALETFLLSLKKAEERGPVSAEQIVGALEKLYNLSLDEDRILIYKGAADVDYPKVQQYLREQLPEKLLPTLDRIDATAKDSLVRGILEEKTEEKEQDTAPEGQRNQTATPVLKKFLEK